MATQAMTKDDRFLARHLDRGVVKEENLKTFSCLIWMWWGGRQYARNSENWRDGFVLAMMYYFVVVLCVLFYRYWPFHLMGLFALSIAALTVLSTFVMANKSIWIGLLNMGIGVIGLHFHIQFGLTFFSHSMEPALFWVFVASGLIYLYRRGWNTVIWKMLDRILWRYYHDQKIDFSSKVKRISNYRYAYDSLSKKVGDFMDVVKQNERVRLNAFAVHCIKRWLGNGTEAGLEKALQVFDREIRSAKIHNQ